jgi:polyhydroxyalkanoate synthesis regulator phasin
MGHQMTSISSSIGMLNFPSPKDRIQDQLETQVAAGTTKATDVDALTAAIDEIDAAMRQGLSESRAGGTRPSPGEIGDKINGLIDGLVEDGKLTSDQAEELKEVFANAAPQGRPGGLASTSSSDESSFDTNELIQELLKMLQDSQSKAASYGPNGSASDRLTGTSLIFDFQT